MPPRAVPPRKRERADLRREGLATLAWPEAFLNRLRGAVKRDAVLLADAPGVLAGREADDVCGVRSDVTHAVSRQRVERIDIDAFALQQIALDAAAEGVVSDAAAQRHHAVTRHDERHDIACHEVGDGTHSARTADLLGEP